MKNNKILKINYIGHSTWIFPILNKLNEEMKQKYNNSDLREWGLSISTKIDMLLVLIDNINSTVLVIRKEFEKNIEDVNNCINNKWAYEIKEVSVFLLLAYVESTIFEMKSIFDLLEEKYIKGFCKILGSGKQNKFLKECRKEYEKKGLDTDWDKLLKQIRDDLIHNYAGWLSFKKVNGSFELMIEMPKINDGDSKKYTKSEYLDRESFKKLSNGFTKFLEITKDFLIEKIGQVEK